MKRRKAFIANQEVNSSLSLTFPNPSFQLPTSSRKAAQTTQNIQEGIFEEIPLNDNPDNASGQTTQIGPETLNEKLSFKAKFAKFFIKRNQRTTPYISVANYSITILFVIFNFCLAQISALPCIDYKRENFDLVDSDECVSEGIVVYQSHVDNRLCDRRVKCPAGHHLRFNPRNGEECGLECACPDWVQNGGCSYLHGKSIENSTAYNAKTKRLLQKLLPQACSIGNSHPKCDPRPTKNKLIHVQLYDETNYMLVQANINYKITNEVKCTGSGVVGTGTAEYCERNECALDGVYHCRYLPNEMIYIKVEDEFIPIMAYGSLEIDLYGFKEKEVNECEKCGIECTKEGINYSLNSSITAVEICSENTCQKIGQPKEKGEIVFESELLIRQHIVSMTAWSNGVRIKTAQIKCDPIDVCEVIHCHFCWQVVANPRCADKWVLVIAGFALNLLAFFLITLVKALKNIFQIIKVLTHFLCLGVGCCKWAANKVKGKTKNKPRISVRRRAKGKIEIQPLLALVAIVTLPKLCCVTLDSTRILQANEEECLVQNTGNVSCTYNNVTVFKMRPIRLQKLQMILQDHAQRSVGTLTLEIEKPYAVCRKRTIGYTRNFVGRSFSETRCNTRGSCSQNFCETMRPQQPIPELSLPQEFPGYSYCVQTPGGMQEGCFPFMRACIFYRVFARPLDLKVYELFDCVQWDVQINVRLKKTTATETQEETVTLSPGLTHTWMSSVKITPIVAEPLTALVTDKFITDGLKTAMISDQQERTINLRCPTREAAKNFTCAFPAEKCRCNVAGSGVNCDCETGDTPKQLLQDPNLIPRQ